MWIRVAVCVFALVALASAEFVMPKEAAAYVRNLGADNFTEYTEEYDMPTFVSFIDPECPYCKELRTEWNNAAKFLDGIVPLVRVDCMTPANEELCDAYDVDAFPTIIMVAERGQRSFQYGNARTTPELIQFAVGALGPNMKAQWLQTDQQWLGFRSWQPSKPHFVLISNKAITPFYMALSIRYYKSAVFAYINAQQSEALVRALGKMQPLKGALDDRHILENTVLEQTGAKRVDIYGRELKASEQNNKEDL